MILTWQQRCEYWNGEIVTNQMIQEKMQEEIDALRSKVDKMQNDIVSLTDDLFSERRECLKFEKEIDELRERLEETRQLYIKQLALQRLSDIGQAIERELTNDEIMEICDEVGRDLTKWGYFQIEFARAILKRAKEK
jgi:uncharacterized coiled-coil DUF342 family protein